jgi:hypothetical protein
MQNTDGWTRTFRQQSSAPVGLHRALCRSAEQVEFDTSNTAVLYTLPMRKRQLEEHVGGQTNG